MAESSRQTLGRYTLLGEVGHGGFATVYRALDATLEREVALKVLHPQLLTDRTFVARFGKEARALASLRHPHVVTIYEVGEADGRLFIAMELARGRNLADAIAQRGQGLPWAEMLAVLKPVCEGLDYAHAQGVVHRDLKPSNILLDDQRGPLLTDFGFASLVGENTVSLSLSGGILGTPAYIPPEVWELDVARAPSDIYALGCIVYEMLTAQVLFAGKTPVQVMRAHDRGPQFPETWPDGVPSELTGVLARALAHEPAERYPSCGALWHALDDLEEVSRAAREAAELAALAAPWRAEAEAALAAGEWRAARMAIGRWSAVLPNDPDALNARAEVDRREAEQRGTREAEEQAARQAAERAAREADEHVARLEAERQAQEEAARQARESAEREAAERAQRESTERATREAEERAARLEAERQVHEEAARQARESAEREAAEHAQRESAERVTREAEQRAARLEAERQAQEEATRRSREAAEREAREAQQRAAREAEARAAARRAAQEEPARQVRVAEERERAALPVAPAGTGVGATAGRRRSWLWPGLILAGLIVVAVVIALSMQPASAPYASPGAGMQSTQAPIVVEVTATPAGGAAPATKAAVATTRSPVPTAVPEVATTAPPPVPVREALLHVNIGTYPDIVDPQRSSFVNEIAHLQLIYEGLTRLDSRLNTVPGAAEKWEYTSDGRTLTFTLRRGLKYSDGTLLNAKRFEYSILRNIDPHTLGEYAAITDEIVGAVDWRSADVANASEAELARLKRAVEVHALDLSGQACLDGADGYAQTDCLVLRINTLNPAPYFHTVMSLWVTYPAKQENIEAGGENWWNSSTYQIGNGPFILQTLEPSVRAYFVPNANYWHDEATYQIEYRYITDGAVAFEAYKNNEFEIVGYGVEDLAQINDDDKLKAQAQLSAGSCTFALMMHQERAPFTDKKVREAFAQAIDREAWVRDVLGGPGAPTLTWIPPGFPGYDSDETRFAFDANKAKAALAESSYGGAAGLPTIKWTFGDTARNRTRAEWFASQYQTALGVTVQLDPVEPATFTAMTRDKATAPLAFILGWCADYPDPQNWLSVYWKTGAFGARVGYSNPAADALMVKGDTTIDPAKRLEYYMEAQRMVIGDLPAVMLYNNVSTYMVKPWVKGAVATGMDWSWPGIVDPLTITIDTTMR